VKNDSLKRSAATASNGTERDDDGIPVKAGDTVRFNYGIPPVVVDAKIVQRSGQLIALTPGHDPAECNLRSLRKYVGNWYKITKG
jgi:hypothetical protein